MLSHYQKRRQADKEATIGVTDGLVHLFANRWAPLVAGRNLGLMAMELFIPARDVLAQRWVGLRVKELSPCKMLMSPSLAAEWSDWRWPVDYRAAACAWRCWSKSSLSPLPRMRRRNSASRPSMPPAKASAAHLGVWSDIVAQRASCYHGMEVWDKDSFGHIAFDDESMGYSHLGHIVENAVIHHALWQKHSSAAT